MEELHSGAGVVVSITDSNFLSFELSFQILNLDGKIHVYIYIYVSI